MKKRIFAVMMAVCMMIGTSAFAQQHGSGESKQKATPEQVAQRRTEHMKKMVDLTDAQAKQIYNLNLETAKNKSADKEQMIVNRKAKMEKIKSILTPEQYSKWVEAQKTQRNHHMKGKACCAKTGAFDKKADSCCNKTKACPSKADSKCKSECKKK